MADTVQNGKGKEPEKGRDFLKFGKGFDAIDFSKKAKTPQSTGKK